MSLLKSEIIKSDQKERDSSPTRSIKSESHEKEHIRTIFLKLMDSLLQG